MFTKASPQIIYCLKSNPLTFQTCGAWLALLVVHSQPTSSVWCLESTQDSFCTGDVIVLQSGSPQFTLTTTITINSQLSLKKKNLSGKKSLKRIQKKSSQSSPFTAGCRPLSLINWVGSHSAGKQHAQHNAVLLHNFLLT